MPYLYNSMSQIYPSTQWTRLVRAKGKG